MAALVALALVVGVSADGPQGAAADIPVSWKWERQAPFSEEELEKAVTSLRNLAPRALTVPVTSEARLRQLLKDSAHESHEDWAQTEFASRALGKIIKGPGDPTFDRIFRAVMTRGYWDEANEAASERMSDPLRKYEMPWVVLVSGLSGIRKTTTMYQPWFKLVLKQALGSRYTAPKDELPDGFDSFYRQLDYIVATVANEDFRGLYHNHSRQEGYQESGGEGYAGDRTDLMEGYSAEEVAAYSHAKTKLFRRYRTYAEMVGAIFIKEAIKRKLNVILETSGADTNAYEYVDHFFPSGSGYRKLVIHFELVPDIKYAVHSVDTRMRCEMADGLNSLERGDVDLLVRANAGGAPYGYAKLRAVQRASAETWTKVSHTTRQGASKAQLHSNWFKAELTVSAETLGHSWTVSAGNAREAFILCRLNRAFCPEQFPFMLFGVQDKDKGRAKPCELAGDEVSIEQWKPWITEWHERLDRWLLTVREPDYWRQCAGALGVFLSGRLTAATLSLGIAKAKQPAVWLRQYAPPPPPLPTDRTSCDAVPQRAEETQLPDFPEMPRSEYQLIPLPQLAPQLVPRWSRGEPLLLKEGGKPPKQRKGGGGGMGSDRQGSLRHGVFAVSMGGATGIVTGVLLLCGLRLRRHRGARVRLRLGRLQI